MAKSCCCAGSPARKKSRTGTARRKASPDASPSTSASAASAIPKNRTSSVSQLAEQLNTEGHRGRRGQEIKVLRVLCVLLCSFSLPLADYGLPPALHCGTKSEFTSPFTRSTQTEKT